MRSFTIIFTCLYIYIYTIDTQDEVICNENINYAKTQNQIREIENKTQRYLTKKFKEKELKSCIT